MSLVQPLVALGQAGVDGEGLHGRVTVQVAREKVGGEVGRLTKVCLY